MAVNVLRSPIEAGCLIYKNQVRAEGSTSTMSTLYRVLEIVIPGHKQTCRTYTRLRAGFILMLLLMVVETAIWVPMVQIGGILHNSFAVYLYFGLFVLEALVALFLVAAMEFTLDRIENRNGK